MLDKVKVDILLFLLEQNGYVTIKDLEKKFHISNRTVRYYLDDIDYWLKINGYISVTRAPRRGIILDIDGKEGASLKKRLLSNKKDMTYNLSPEERQQIIIFYLLKAEEIVNLADLAEITKVSEATISNDLNNVGNWFQKYNIELNRKKGVGLSLQGSEKDMRQAIAANLRTMATKEKEYSSYNINNQIGILEKWFPELDLIFIRDQIVFAENYLEIKFSDDEFINLLTHIALAIERIKLDKDIVMDKDSLNKLNGKEEYKVACHVSKKLSEEFNISMPEDEIGYITLHLVAAKVSKVSNNEKYFGGDEKLSGLIDEMVKEVEKILKIRFMEEYPLKRDLYIHLKPAIARIKYGKSLENPLLSQIKSQYKDVYLACEKASSILAKEYNIEINEHEISYITMHFGSSIEIQNISDSIMVNVNVILICASGIGTSKLLYAQLVSCFTSFQVVDILSYQEALEYDNYENIDLIISTIPLDFQPKPTIMVTPLLSAEDIELLSKYLMIIDKKTVNYNNSLLIMEILQTVSKHCQIENIEGLQMDLISLFNDINKLSNINTNYQISKGILSKENIQIHEKCDNWQEAIRKAAWPLVNQGSIDEIYIENIIKRFDDYGPYMVIAPGIALPHASTDEGVYDTQISIMTLKEPIVFNHPSNDPVHTVIVLAARDNYSHIETLNRIIDVLSIKDNVDLLRNSTNAEEILNLINSQGGI
ncbi:MAG: BglG family transcription antiterminator [Tissierellia bacterium]|nr:BglG family transcription antiterminator [Tissierellia bacterium]